ncbi:MAG: hypothetical protein GY861_00845 [bacterium]|nr:hypothetical protein [bacterium]
MSQNAAMEGELGSLHSLLCGAYRKLLVDEDGVLLKEIDPRVLGHINKFLADNKIHQNAEPGNDISELSQDLQKRKKRFGKENITDIATEMAKKEALG